MPNQVGNSSWRPSAAWMTVAAVFVVVSLGSNFLAMRHSYFDSTPVGAMLLSDLIGRLLDDVVRLLLCLGGLLILWRGSGRSSFLLGMALIAMSPIPLDGTPMGPAARVAWRLGVEGVFDLLWSAILPLFAMAFLTQSGMKIPRWSRPAFWLCFGTSTLNFVFLVILPGDLASDQVYGIAKWLMLPIVLTQFALTFGVLAVGLRKGDGGTRHRFALLLVALVLIFVTYLLFMIFDPATPAGWRLLINTSTACRLSGSLLLAYAVLRHRIIDVGFTVNRALVYGGVSAILLVSFGLAEWAIGQLPAFQGWQSNALFSAGLAVAVVLTFHPVTRFVEHNVSTLFFRPWRDKERMLREFVKEAAFFTDASKLAMGFSDALERFSGARCSVYLLDEQGLYECQSVKVGAIHPDDATAVTLRAHGKGCEIQCSRSSVEGALAFAMMQGHDLDGFTAMGAKLNGERYRPDEVALAEWATHEVGQELYGLSVRRLKAEAEARERQIAVLAGRNTELQHALASAHSAKRS